LPKRPILSRRDEKSALKIKVVEGPVKTQSTWFQRILLPGLAFKAVVIGGGYATGRELVSFFLASGPWGGLWGMSIATVIWSVVCILTFVFALQTRSGDYRTFFQNLLGPAWPVFEVAYLCAIVVMLAVFAAAAGAIGQALFGWPPALGAFALVAAITLVAAFGNDAVEGLFKYVSFFLYGTYALFLLLAVTRFGDQILGAFAAQPAMTGGALSGATYAGYNVVGAVVILPVIRHMTGRRDAVIAGALAGPLAMLPALLFFLCMAAYYPQIGNETLPSDFLLQRLDAPAFRIVFQLMIFSALLESGAGGVHAINQRISHAYEARRGQRFSTRARLAVTLFVLTVSVFVADRVGLVALIAKGYAWLSYAFLAIYVLPLATLGLAAILRARRAPLALLKDA
jgi:uncharacterized membrane protein YkvI